MFCGLSGMGQKHSRSARPHAQQFLLTDVDFQKQKPTKATPETRKHEQKPLKIIISKCQKKCEFAILRM